MARLLAAAAVVAVVAVTGCSKSDTSRGRSSTVYRIRGDRKG